MPFRTRLMLSLGVMLFVVSGVMAVRAYRGESFWGDDPADDPSGRAEFNAPSHEQVESIADYLREQGLTHRQVDDLVHKLEHGGFHHGQAVHFFEEMRKVGLDASHVAEVASLLDSNDLTGGGRAVAHPHGNQVCASGCAASNHPTKPLTKAEFNRLMAAYATEPTSDESEALAALVYYGRQTRVYLDRFGDEPLDEQRAAFLRQELARTHVMVSFRLVDESGEVRAYLPPTRVPFDIRHEFRPDVFDLQPLITSGTVKRTRLRHIWQRL